MSESTICQIVLAARPPGRPQADNFRLEQAAMPTTPSGSGVLLRVLYLSLDPYMRGRMDERKSYARPVKNAQPSKTVKVWSAAGRKAS
jgi:NADPH-dependent curcumin reductase